MKKTYLVCEFAPAFLDIVDDGERGGLYLPGIMDALKQLREVEISSRDLSQLKIPEGVYRFRFFDCLEAIVKEAGEKVVLRSKEMSHSPWHYSEEQGRLFTPDMPDFLTEEEDKRLDEAGLTWEKNHDELEKWCLREADQKLLTRLRQVRCIVKRAFVLFRLPDTTSYDQDTVSLEDSDIFLPRGEIEIDNIVDRWENPNARHFCVPC
ncbi:hypothetical protein EPN28_01440 [Patescibacteria group bacterium]|nr:MAG: hypothetical protein EPN28_01440 [Patescibacteria group bacterium]